MVQYRIKLTELNGGAQLRTVGPLFDGSIVEQVTDQLDDNQLRTKVISAESAGRRTAIDVLDKPQKSNLLTAFDKYASQFAKETLLILFNFINHGFYNLCPILYPDFYENNGFKTIQLKGVAFNQKQRLTTDLKEMFQEFSVFDLPADRSIQIKSDIRINVLYVAQKKQQVDSYTYPIQSKYRGPNGLYTRLNKSGAG